MSIHRTLTDSCNGLQARTLILSLSLGSSFLPHPVREIPSLTLGHIIASAQARSYHNFPYAARIAESHRKAFAHTRISINFTLSSNAWNGPAPPSSLSTCPAHTRQLIGLKCSVPFTRPTQTSTTETRVSREMSRGKTAKPLSDIGAAYREACSWAE